MMSASRAYARMLQHVSNFRALPKEEPTTALNGDGYRTSGATFERLSPRRLTKGFDVRRVIRGCRPTMLDARVERNQRHLLSLINDLLDPTAWSR